MNEKTENVLTRSSPSDVRNALYANVEWEEDDDSADEEEKTLGFCRQSSATMSSSTFSSSSLDDFVRDYGLGSVAYSIEIPISLSATDIKSSDNETLLELIMEISKHLYLHILPRVKKVLENYAEISSCSTDKEGRRERQILKRKNNKTHEDLERRVISDKEKTLVEIIKHAEELLETKCKPLFLSSSSSTWLKIKNKKK